MDVDCAIFMCLCYCPVVLSVPLPCYQNILCHLSHSFRTDPMTGTEVIAKRAPSPLTRTVMVQTDYRDSETQTDPYSPEYVIQPGSQPELLTLATLAYGNFEPSFFATGFLKKIV